MSFEAEFEKLKEDFFDFFYKYKIYIISISAFSAVCALGVFFYLRNDYLDRIDSSNKLIEYISGENDKFLNKKHKKGYATVVEFINNKQNPSAEKFDEFAKIDEFVFKNLFYFAKRLYFGTKDDFYSFYECDKHPWSKLMNTCDIFYKDKNSSCIKQKDDYLVSFLIGEGVEC